MVNFLRVASAAAAVAIVGAATAMPWTATTTMNKPGFYDIGPGFWTDGFAMIIGQSFDGSEDFFTPGSVSNTTFLPTEPRDYHQNCDVFFPAGPGPGKGFTEIDYDFIWGPGVQQLVVPLFVAIDDDIVISVAIDFDHNAQVDNPDIDVEVDGNPVFAGVLADFDPANFGLQDQGTMRLNFYGCVQDIDFDGSVGLSDLLSVLAAFGNECIACQQDLNMDGEVGLGDIIGILSAWGPC